MQSYHWLFLKFFAGTLMSTLWVPDKKICTWKLRRPSHVTVVETGEPAAESPDRPRPDSHFQLKYDKVQVMIRQIGCMDELLSGYYENCSPIIPLILQ